MLRHLSPAPGDSEVISQIERLSSKETKIAPRSLRMALGASGRSALTCMAVSRVGVRNLTLPERRSLSTSPWDLVRSASIEQLVARYNAEGPDALGDLRRRNGSTARVLTPEVLAKLPVRFQEAPDNGGLWTSAKVASFFARTGVGKSRRSARLGGAEGLRHVDPDAAPEKSQVRHAGRGGYF